MTTEPTRAPEVAGLRVATVPAAAGTAPLEDAYLDAALPAGIDRVVLPGDWADPERLAACAPGVDVLHLQARRPGMSDVDLEPWAEAVRRLNVPLVVTVHDLRARPGSRYGRNLAAVLATAEVVLTLTPGAADEIAARFGRTPIVVAHPSIAAPVPDLGGERGLVGLVLATAGRAHLEELVRAALCGAVSGGGRLRVLAEPGTDLPWLRAMAEEDGLEAVEVQRGGPGWTAALQELHVAVLPEHCGTHSRDLEICRDVGTSVVAPRSGWFAGQWSEVVTYAADGDRLDALSLTLAVTAALTRPAPRPADRAWRVEQRAAVQRVHAQVYAQVAADRLWT